jgi:hypothetical protein
MLKFDSLRAQTSSGINNNQHRTTASRLCSLVASVNLLLVIVYLGITFSIIDCPCNRDSSLLHYDAVHL